MVHAHCLFISTHATMGSGILQAMTIKIISSKAPAEANLQAVEREEQILAAAKILATASGKSDPADLEICAAKIRSMSSRRADNSINRLVTEVASRLSAVHSVPWAINSLDMDVERIMQLLEG